MRGADRVASMSRFRELRAALINTVAFVASVAVIFFIGFYDV